MTLKQVFKLMMLFAIVAPFTVAQAPTQQQDPATRIQTRVKALGDFISMTDVQRQQMTTILTEADKASTLLREPLAPLRLDLRAAVRSNNSAAIDTLSAKIANIDGTVSAAAAKANAAIYGLMTPEQKVKLDTATTADAGLRWMGVGIAPITPAPSATPAAPSGAAVR